MVKLPHLEQTVTEIVVELITLDQEQRFPDLLFGDSNDNDCVRITMHYVVALLAYGFSHEEAELQKALRWFNKPFPRQKPDFMDVLEMNRLMILLRLQPELSTVKLRLEQLAEQKSSDYFDVQPGWPEFDTLWTLEAFALAKQNNVLDNAIVTLQDIKQQLHNLVSQKELKRDKDVALALNLQYDLFGTLGKEDKRLLDELLNIAENNGGLWGMREFGWRMKNMHWYRELLKQNQLTYSDIQNDRQIFRKVVVSSCMVIEYLMPLVETYPEIRPYVDKAIHLLWKQIYGSNAILTLRSLFPNPYDYILVLSRLLRAICAYAGHPLLGLNSTHLLRRITQLQMNVVEDAEVRNIKNALREWMQVDISGHVERLKLGLSEASVVRVNPFIYSPLINEDDKPMSLIPYSLIIKYGPSDMIDLERRSYETLPVSIRDMFVRIPETTYTDPNSGLSFVVMQDLRDYKTLYEANEDLPQNINTIAQRLANFLQKMHEGGTSETQTAPPSLLREIYLSRMMEYIDRIFNFLWQHHLYEDGEDEEIREIQYELFDRIGDIIKNQQRLERFPAAIMHGDLHMRNIMVYGLGKSRSRKKEIKFKLIDLEFMHSEGDAAFDAGQLFVDIDLVSREEQRIESQEELHQLKQILEDSYYTFGKNRNDHTFELRVELAKARALLRIAKGRTKRGSHFVMNNQTAQAIQIGRELVGHAHEALEYLRIVVEDMPAKIS